MDPVPASDSRALTRKASEQQPFERRRSLVAKWYVQGYANYQIRDALKAEGIIASAQMVFDDVAVIRRHAREYLSADKFAARDELAIIIARYTEIIRNAQYDARSSTDMKDRAIMYRIIGETQQKLTDLYERCGFIDETIGRRIADPTREDTRIPTGTEIAARVADVVATLNVVEGQLVPEAELAWRHGDMAAATKAAQDSGQ